MEQTKILQVRSTIFPLGHWDKNKYALDLQKYKVCKEILHSHQIQIFEIKSIDVRILTMDIQCKIYTQDVIN